MSTPASSAPSSGSFHAAGPATDDIADGAPQYTLCRR